MAVDRVVKTVEIREEGGQRVYDRISSLTGEVNKLAAAENALGSAQEQGARRAADTRRSFERLEASRVSDTRAVKELERNLKTLNAAKLSGIIGETELLEKATRELQLAFDPAFRQIQKMQQELEALAFVEREGIQIMGGYESALNKIILKYDETAQAAAKAAAAQKLMIESARADQAAQTSQISYNDMLGVRAGPRNSARDSGLFFKEQADAADELTARVARIRAEIDPMTAAQSRYNAEVAEYVRLNQMRLLSDDELAMGMQTAQQRLFLTSRSLGTMKDNTKLSALEMQNLGYQVNDVATMLLMGASPFQIMASQGGQVYQILAGTQGGVKGALSGLASQAKSLAVAIGPIGIAFAALAAAAGAFAYAFNQEVEPIEDALARQDQRIRGLKDAYGVAAQASEDYGRRSIASVELAANITVQKDIERLRDETTGLITDIFSGRENAYRRVQPQFEELRNAFNALGESAKNGVPDFAAFEDELARIAETGATDEVKELAKEVFGAVPGFVELQEGIEGARNAMDDAARSAANLRVNFAESMEGLGKFARDSRTEVQQINDLFAEALESARSLSAYEGARRARDAAIAPIVSDAEKTLREAKAERATVGLSAEAEAIADVNRKYDELVASVEGATAAVDAYNAARNVEIDRIQAESAEKEAEKARKAAEEWQKATQQRIQGAHDSVEALQLELTTIGMTEPAAAALRAEYEMVTAAKRAAAEAGMIVSPEELAYYKDAAQRIGEFTAAIDAATEAKRRMKRLGDFEADLDFDISTAGLPDIEKNILGQLRDLEVQYESLDGQRLSGKMRLLDAMEREQEEMEKTRDVAKDFVSTLVDGLASGEGALDSLVNAFAKLGQQMAQAGLDKLMDQVFGTGPQASGGGFSGVLQQFSKTFSNPQAAASRSTFAAPMAEVVREPLAAIKSAGFDLAEGIRLSAKSLGVSAKDIATIISYETGGTFDPRQRGPTTQWGQHRGLIQFGEPQAARFGVDFSTAAKALETQLGENGALVKYMKAAGVKPGMKIIDLYSAVNAGSVGRYNASDANNGGAWGTVADKVNFQMDGHAIKAEKLLGSVSVGAKTGIVEGLQSVASAAPAASTDAWGGLRAANAPQTGNVASIAQPMPANSVGGFLQSPVAQTGLMALGSFSAGMQSGSPVGGGLMGALGGFAQGGPVGAIVGGLSGLLGGLFGKSKQKKAQEEAERKQAEQAWEQNYLKFQEITDVVTRTQTGPLRKHLREIDDTLEQYRKLAEKTKDGAKVAEVEASISAAEEYRAFLYDNFRRDLPKMTEDLGEGLGLDSMFVKTRDAVMQMGDQYRAFIDDVKEAYKVPVEERDTILANYEGATRALKDQKAAALQSLEDQAKTVNGAFWEVFHAGKKVDNPLANLGLIGTEWGASEIARLTGGNGSEQDIAAMEAAAIARDEALAAYEAKVAKLNAERDKAIEEATNAAARGLLSIVSGDKADQSDVEKAMDEAAGAAAGLRTVLRDLGATAEDTALYIDDALKARVANLREEFTKGLTYGIVEMRGEDHLADIAEFMEEVEKTMRSAELVDADMAIVETYLTAKAQSIVDNVGLVGDAFAAVAAQFPEFAAMVKQAEAGMGEFGQMVQSYQDRAFAARNDTSTFEGQRDALLLEYQRTREDVQRNRQGTNEVNVAVHEAFVAELEKLTREFSERREEMRLGYQNRVFAAGNDTSTIEGRLAAFDREAAQERMQVAKENKELLVDLEAALGAERLRIIRDHNEQALDDAKSFFDGWTTSLQQFVDGLKTGADSPLAPKDRLAEAQRLYDEQYSKAMAGDREAANNLTQYASDLLEASKSYDASSPAFQAVFDRVVAQLEAVPDQVSAEQFIVDAIEESAGEITSTLDHVREQLAEAILGGSQASATAIGLYFASLDTTVDGLLTFDELSAGLAGKATDAEIRKVFDEIDINGDAMISKFEQTLAEQGLTRTNLVSAVNDNAVQTAVKIAAGLSSDFTRLDTSINGLISFDEMRVALGGMATDAQIRALINVIDTDGDGQISKLEAINATNKTGNTLTTTSNAIMQNLSDSASYQNGQQNSIRAAVQQSLNYESGILGVLNTHTGQLERVILNLRAANHRSGAGQYADGGYTGPGGKYEIAGDVHKGEVVWSQNDIARAGGVGAVEAMRTGRVRMPTASVMPIMAANDGGVVAAVRDLGGRLERIETAVQRGSTQVATVTAGSGEATRETLRDGQKQQEKAARDQRTARKMAS